MKIEIWSDVVCPWCYIGKRRLEKALGEFEHSEGVELVWRSFELDPNAPRASQQTVSEHLAEKYGMSVQQADAANARVTAIAAQEGLEYHLEKAKLSNTFDAHRLIHLGAVNGLQNEVQERIMHAYFSEGLPVGDTDTLVRLAAEAGLEAGEARATLESGAYADEVRADEQRARAFGISGVPFFAINEKYGISGAQPSDVLKQVLEEIWEETHPPVSTGA